jgi:hypothetical protein
MQTDQGSPLTGGEPQGLAQQLLCEFCHNANLAYPH